MRKSVAVVVNGRRARTRSVVAVRVSALGSALATAQEEDSGAEARVADSAGAHRGAGNSRGKLGTP